MKEYITLSNCSSPAEKSICGIWNWIKMTVPILMWNNMWLGVDSYLHQGQSLHTDVLCFMEILEHVKLGKMNKSLCNSICFAEEDFMLEPLARMRDKKIKIACFKALVWKTQQQLCPVLWPILQWMVTFGSLLTVKGNLTQLCWCLKGQLSLSDIPFFSKRAGITACGNSHAHLRVCP